MRDHSPALDEIRPRLQTVLGAAIFALALLLVATVRPAFADRFGPPWQSKVIAPNAASYQQPSTTSPVVGKLDQSSHVVVLGESTDANGNAWTQIVGGYVPSNEIQEDYGEWVAQVISPNAINVYAEPDANSAIRRDASNGDLLRVVGVSAGVNGDPSIWWATTEGYVHLGTLAQGTSNWAKQWTLPNASEAPNGWWAAVISDANVRAGATTQAPIVGQLYAGNMVKVLSQAQGENVQGSKIWYRIDGGRYAGAWIHSSLVQKVAPPQASLAPNPSGGNAGLWIVVSKSNSTLTVIQNGNPIFVTYTSLGVTGRQTPSGVYGTYSKYVADRMTSSTVPDALNAYNLPNVPWTQYYTESGAAIHGAYWHDDFGGPHSEGCINLTWTDSWYVFNLTKPIVLAGQISAQAADGGATPVVIVG